MVLLYDNKLTKFPGKFCMHWLGPYQVKYVTTSGIVQLVKLNGEMLSTLVNGSRMKLHKDNPPSYLAPR